MKKLIAVEVVLIQLMGTLSWACVAIVDDGYCGLGGMSTTPFPSCDTYGGWYPPCQVVLYNPARSNHVQPTESSGYTSGYTQQVQQTLTLEVYQIKKDANGQCIGCGKLLDETTTPSGSCTQAIVEGDLCVVG
jgi:hypothetical protein